MFLRVDVRLRPKPGDGGARARASGSAATLQLLRRKVGRKAVDQPDALRVWRGYLSTDGGDLRIDKCERAWCLLSHDSHGYVENHYE